jgi:predicted dinucleotide-binding enzyme
MTARLQRRASLAALGDVRQEETTMSTAIIGTGNIGRTIAGQLVAGGERVVLASRETPDQLANQLGNLATATTVPEAIDAADVVILAVWLEVTRGLIEENLARLANKVVVDPSNPVALNDKGEISRILPEGVSSGSVVAELLPDTSHFVKALGTLSAGSLEKAANRTPQRAVLFYATDDAEAQTAIERLISISGFDPVKAGGIDAAIRIEVGGDLNESGLNGQLVDAEQARVAIASRR